MAGGGERGWQGRENVGMIHYGAHEVPSVLSTQDSAFRGTWQVLTNSLRSTVPPSLPRQPPCHSGHHFFIRF